ncbi:BA14K family protein [Mesorhizobium sp. LHD-90]|uniref:BA14K family protein n=1 Tax=Mesorhizobium sp. LHD-90 TaxID=3071414 RepID=UPI0027E1B476|nr:BA14K family protein [Mesorhizobium sp. LHD-90]MDQ6434519.1 BA14K family protein [Mesorhizobium sp. LHD-90]
MRKFLSGLCATALAFSVTLVGLAPVQAAPVYVPQTAVKAQGDVIQVQNSERRKWRREARRDRREWRRDNRRDRREWRRDRREARRDWRRDGRRGYYRGHRGYDYYRPGYRRYDDGFWYPAAAFAAGAILGGAIASEPRVVVREGGSHTQWCYNRYRSYRAYDNTFQPYNGPRQQCVSPYDY